LPTATARLVNSPSAAGGPVVGAGTTVVGALASAAAPDRTVTAAADRTHLVLRPSRQARW
jgi:S-adenosylmethionine:tRNA ribosyltransferase-isomerase